MQKTGYDNPVRLVRELKGAPLSILVLLLLVRQPLPNGAISSGTGYSDKTVADGLYYLESNQLVTRSRLGWSISEGFQLPIVTDTDTENFRMRSSSSVNPLINTNDNEIILLEDSENFRKNIEAMHDYGIAINKLTRQLAAESHVTPEYIAAHCNKVRQEKQKVGLAIHRMCNKDPMPGDSTYVTGDYSDFIKY